MHVSIIKSYLKSSLRVLVSTEEDALSCLSIDSEGGRGHEDALCCGEQALLVIASANSAAASQPSQPARPHGCLSHCSQVVARLQKFCLRGACALGLLFIQELIWR